MKKKQQQVSDKKLKVIPIGGLDHIGRNMTLFEYEGSIIIVDCGIMFPTAEMPGIDFIIPDFSYIRENISKVKALVVTHGHEDHIGGISYLLQEFDIPVYATKLTLGLIHNRLKERPPKSKVVTTEVAAGQTSVIGPFSIEYIQVSHSIVDGVALAITTPVGVVIHTGDFKIDHTPVDGRPTNLSKFAEYGEKGVLLLLSDSTNAGRPGYSKSEISLNEPLQNMFADAKGRLIVATFSTNINRIQQVLNAAQKYNRKVVVSGRAMLNNIEIAKKLGYLKFKDDLLVNVSELKVLQDKKIIVLCTGTQGEPMSALTRISKGTHHTFVGCAGDRFVITASVIPGNERPVGQVVNSLMKMGADVNYEETSEIHVSGHANQEELKVMISLVKPQFFMPIHGEHKHLRAHADLAASLNIKTSNIIVAENGCVLELTPYSFSQVDKLNIKTIYIDGQNIDDIDNSIIKDRVRMTNNGVLIMIVNISQGFLLTEPVIISRGFADGRDEKLLNYLRKEISGTVSRIMPNKPSHNEVKAAIKKNIKRNVFKYNRDDDRPVVEIIINEV